MEVEKELKRLARRFQAELSDADYAYLEHLKERSLDFDWQKSQLNLKQKPKTSFIKESDRDQRIFPGYFASIMIQENGKRIFKPMRYRLRPASAKEEIPSKFNVFNARLDSLENRQTWSPLFMRQHGIFPFRRFFEWVEDAGKPRLISFAPEDRELMWAPCLWDQWTSPDGSLSFYSFALITDDPPREIAERGHDRCPIFLREDQIESWLSPAGKTKSEIYRLLKNKETVVYNFHWAS